LFKLLTACKCSPVVYIHKTNKIARFLLARLHIDSLLDKRTKQKVLSTLNKLSKGSAKLDDAYGEAIKRIDGQLDEDRLLARRAISWITYARRPLTTKELCHALAIEQGDKSLNNNNIYDVDDVISVCAGLVTVDKESSIIRLVHCTTREYFERVRLDWNPSTQKDIAAACLTYLSFDTFRSGSCSSDELFNHRLAENAFFDYSAHYWSEHLRPIQNSSLQLTLDFLSNEILVNSTTQCALAPVYKYKGYSQSFPSRTSGLHLTARYGLLDIIEKLLKGEHGEINIRPDLDDAYGQTPLSLAAQNGHEEVVKLLLDTGKVDVDSKDTRFGLTPLMWAERNGHEAVVKLLLDTGKVNVDSEDTRLGLTPLLWAALNGHEAVVKLLLDTGKVDLDSRNTKYGLKPLSLAAQNGHEAVVKLLLDTGKVDVDSKSSKYGLTPLSIAAQNGHEAVVELLLNTGKVDVNSKDTGYGLTPLSLAARNGHKRVVKLLLDTGKADADLKDIDGQTPLLWATKKGHKAVVELLQAYIQ
jgi:ankyrin repeat protein